MRAALRSLVLAGLLVLAACGEDGTTAEEVSPPDDAVAQTDDDEAEEPTEEPTEEPADDGAADDGTTDDGTADDAAGGDAAVAVASTDLGDVLVDASGMTLYVFDPDDQGASTCNDDCAAAWPPLVTSDEPTAGDGADAALLSTSERDDGSMQVTYDGWPLYRWASDSEPGDVTGQGVNDVWWVMTPDGTPLRDDAA